MSKHLNSSICLFDRPWTDPTRPMTVAEICDERGSRECSPCIYLSALEEGFAGGGGHGRMDCRLDVRWEVGGEVDVEVAGAKRGGR